MKFIKVEMILFVVVAMAVPMYDQKQQNDLRAVIDRLSNGATELPKGYRHRVAHRLEQAASHVTAMAAASSSGQRTRPSPPGESLYDYLVILLESVETSINSIITYLGGTSNGGGVVPVNPGSLPPVSSATSINPGGTMITAPPPSSVVATMPFDNTSYIMPTPSLSVGSPGSSYTSLVTPTPISSADATVNSTISYITPTPVPPVNATSNATVYSSPTPTPPASTTSSPFFGFPPPPSTFLLSSPAASNSSVGPIVSVGHNFTTFMPIPIMSSAAAADTSMSSQAMLSVSAGVSTSTLAIPTPSPTSSVEAEIEKLLEWLLDFLEAQIKSAESSAGSGGALFRRRQ